MTDRLRASFALVPDWVDERVTDGTAMRLYVRLARRYADRQRHAFPGEVVLAEELGCTDRTVRRAVGILEATGALVIARERKADGHFGRNLYYLPTEDPAEVDGRKQTSSGGRKQVSAGRRKQTSDLPEETNFRSEPDPLEQPDPKSNQTSEANASGSDANASCRDRHDVDQTSGREDHEPRMVEDQTRHEEKADARDQDTLFSSWPGLDQEPQPNSTKRSTSTGEVARRPAQRRKRDDLTDEQTRCVKHIVGAWVDAYRAAHAKVQPTIAKRGQAARDIRALIAARNDPARVLAAAESAARAGYATVETELARLANGNGHRTGNGRPGYVPYQNPEDDSVYDRPIS